MQPVKILIVATSKNKKEYIVWNSTIAKFKQSHPNHKIKSIFKEDHPEYKNKVKKVILK